MNGKQLGDLIHASKLTKSQAADRLGITRATLYKWLLRPTLPSDVIDKIKIALTQSINPENLVPYVDVVATASISSVEVWDDDNSTPKSFINLGETLPRSEVVIRVSGNSMTPNYPSGCLIGLRVITDGLFDYGSVYVIETPDNRFLKRIYKGKNDAHIQCYSDNTQIFAEGVRKGQPWYEPFQLPLSKIKRVFKVVGCIKHNDHSHIPEF